jgi:pimeloyl-ACP methyl ester carboxylesterase
MTVLYLHGFASSPQSSKATYLARRFAEHGIAIVTPDLNLPDFSSLTVSRMLEQAGQALADLPAGPVAVIGSSLGGFVAVQTALQHPDRVAALVLLAPALDFAPSIRSRPLGSRTVDEWKRAGTLDVFHYGYNRLEPVRYGLYEDACRYDAMDAALAMPILVFQGTRDDAVDPATVEAWSRRRPNVELHLLDDDHQLTRSLPYIWNETERFIRAATR